jgi:hypothetical protein
LRVWEILGHAAGGLSRFQRPEAGGQRPDIRLPAFQPRLITYLGYDPFTNPTLGSPKSNEPSCVAFLSKDAPVTLGQKMKRNRLKLRKTRKQMASELGVSVKTLWGRETDLWQPTSISEIC